MLKREGVKRDGEQRGGEAKDLKAEGGRQGGLRRAESSRRGDGGKRGQNIMIEAESRRGEGGHSRLRDRVSFRQQSLNHGAPGSMQIN